MPIPLPGGWSIGTSEDVFRQQATQQLAQKQQESADAAAVMQKLATMGDDDARIIAELPKTNRPPTEAAAKLIQDAVLAAQGRQRARGVDLNALLTRQVQVPGTPGTPAREDAAQGMTVMGTPGTPATTQTRPTSLTERVLGAAPIEALNPAFKGLTANLVNAGESEAKLGASESGRWTKHIDREGRVWLIDGKTSQVKRAEGLPGQFLEAIPDLNPSQLKMLEAQGVPWAATAGQTEQGRAIDVKTAEPPKAVTTPEGGTTNVLPVFRGASQGYGAGAPAAPAAAAPPAPAEPMTRVPPPGAPPAAAPAITPPVNQAGPTTAPDPRALALAILKTPGGIQGFQALSPEEREYRLADATMQVNTPGRRDPAYPPVGLSPATPAVPSVPSATPAQAAPSPAVAPAASPTTAVAGATPGLPPGTITIQGRPKPMDKNRADTILAAPQKHTPEEVQEADNFIKGVQKRAIETVEAEAKARADVDLAKKMQQKIGDDNIKWVDATSESLDPPSPDLATGKLFADPRYVQLETPQRTALKSLNTVREQLKDMKAKVGEVFRPGEDPKKAWLRIQREKWFGTNQQQVKLAQLDTYRTILAPQIQKVALQDVGNMAVQEQAVVAKALAQPFNSLESAMAGLDVLEKFLEATPKRILEQGRRQMGRAGMDPDAVPSGILVPMPAAAGAPAGGGGVVGAPVPRKPKP